MYGKEWTRFWKQQQKRHHPCGDVCIYTILMTVTKMSDPTSKRANVCSAKHREGCLVSGFSVVADARGGQSKHCVQKQTEQTDVLRQLRASAKTMKKGSTEHKKVSAQIQELEAPLANCRAMLWIADGIARDALADVRFQIAKSIVP